MSASRGGAPTASGGLAGTLTRAASGNRSTAAGAAAAAAASSSSSSASAAASSGVRGAHVSLDDYDIRETLGTGTFGTVKLAQHKRTGELVAIKRLNKAQVAVSRQTEQILNEKRLLSACQHPNVVRLHGTTQDRRFVYMVMEFVQGGEMFSHLRRGGKLTNATAKFFAAQIVSALEYLHQQGVVYRDLKPENLLLDADGYLKLTDFGFAKRIATGRTSTMCGTPAYLAPEIILREGHSYGVDWWALGVLIFEMLAGYPPFLDDGDGENSPFGMYQQILAGRVQFPRFMDASAIDLIRRLLNINVGERLGKNPNNADDIKTHPWFKSIPWKALYERRIPSPIKPKLARPDDVANFDMFEDPPERQELLAPKYNDLFAEF